MLRYDGIKDSRRGDGVCVTDAPQRSAYLKSAATPEFGPAITAEHQTVLDALHAGDVEATRFERAANRLAARADFA